MADYVTSNESLKQRLKPFHQRASEAEERLSRIEAVISIQQGKEEEFEKKVKEIQSKMEKLTAKLAMEREKVAKLTAENHKKDYRIIHLVQSIRELDSKLEKSTAI